MRLNGIDPAHLKADLERLGPGFRARLCGVCGGAGEHEQLWTAGCGMGYYRAMGDCDHCGGTGLMSGRERAPASVVCQVVEAGKAALAARAA